MLSGQAREYLRSVRNQLAAEGVESWGRQRLKVILYAYPPDKRHRDLDNIQKPALDALEGMVFDNDSQIDDLRTIRMAPRQPGLIEIEIHPADVSNLSDLTISRLTYLGTQLERLEVAWAEEDYPLLDYILGHGRRSGP